MTSPFSVADELRDIEKRFRDKAESNPGLFTLGTYGRYLSDNGRHEDSLTYFARAMRAADSGGQSLTDVPESMRRTYLNIKTAYAGALEAVGDMNGAEEAYRWIINEQPPSAMDPLVMGNFAFFLHRRRKKYDEAELMYRKSIELFPSQATILCKYAAFVKNVRKNPDEAERLYRQAIAANPSHGEALGSFAAFLHGVRGNIEEARSMYDRACEADSTNTNNLSNYGLFLSEVLQDFVKAEDMYRVSFIVND